MTQCQVKLACACSCNKKKTQECNNRTAAEFFNYWIDTIIYGDSNDDIIKEYGRRSYEEGYNRMQYVMDAEIGKWKQLVEAEKEIIRIEERTRVIGHCIKCVEAEEELEGEMPVELPHEINRIGLSEALRVVVRLTKRGIIERIKGE